MVYTTVPQPIVANFRKHLRNGLWQAALGPHKFKIWEAMIEQANENSEMECFQNGNVSSELVYKK